MNATNAKEARSLLRLLRPRLGKSSPLPWSVGWSTSYLHDDWQCMEATGPQTIALKSSDPRFNSLVRDVAFADSELIEAAVNSLPRIIALLERVTEDERTNA